MKRKIGQNFLINDQIAERIVSALELKKGEKVLEIGPGKGILTKKIAKTNNITAVEIDKTLIKELKNIKGAEIISGDIFKTSIPDYDKIISNLPYDITEPFFKWLAKRRFKKGVFMISERSFRIITSKKGRMGRFIWTHFDTRPILEVGKKEFYPKPKVNSQVIDAVRIDKKNIKDPKRALLRDISDQEDKKLKNGIRKALVSRGKTKTESKEMIAKHFLQCTEFSEKSIDTLTNQEIETLWGCIEKI